MKRHRRRWLAATAVALVLAAGGSFWWQQRPTPAYLSGDTTEFVALFAEPPARDSETTRHELDELLELQKNRTAAQVEAAQADRRTRISRFADALGLKPEDMDRLPALQSLAQQVEDDIRPHVRAAKHRFRRLRPYEIEPRLEPCIDDVRGDLSYPSGHAVYGYVMALVLIELVPERADQLHRRAEEYAAQRKVCGVHFESDIEAARWAAVWLAQRIHRNPQYRTESESARLELRTALGLGPGPRAPPPGMD